MAQEPIKLTDSDRQQIVNEVIEHFRQHPQELVESIVKWRESQSGDAEKVGESEKTERLPDPFTGRTDAPVSIIEFSDYGCAECNAVSATLLEVASMDPDIRIIHRDSPRSSMDATAASIDMISVASKPGGKWQQMRAVYMKNGVQPETRIKALAEGGVEIDNADRRKAAKTMEVSTGLATRAGATSLPAIIVIVGNKVQALSGMQSKENILQAVASVSRAAAAQMAK
jgi:protein-disulfide isomerase